MHAEAGRVHPRWQLGVTTHHQLQPEVNSQYRSPGVIQYLRMLSPAGTQSLASRPNKSRHRVDAWKWVERAAGLAVEVN